MSEFDDWQRHEVTKGIARDLQEEQAKILVRLLSAARVSEDVAVRAFVTQSDTINRMILTMTKKQEEEQNAPEPDEDDTGEDA